MFILGIVVLIALLFWSLANVGAMNVRCKFHSNSLKKSTMWWQKNIWKVLWKPWISEQHFTTIHSLAWWDSMEAPSFYVSRIKALLRLVSRGDRGKQDQHVARICLVADSNASRSGFSPIHPLNPLRKCVHQCKQGKFTLPLNRSLFMLGPHHEDAVRLWFLLFSSMCVSLNESFFPHMMSERQTNWFCC